MGKQKGEGRRNGLFQEKKNKGGWGYGIFRGIEETIASGISKG